MYKNIDKFYNSEAKLHYLEESNFTQASKDTMYYNLQRADKTQWELNKDIYEMNVDELTELLDSCGFNTATSAKTFYSSLMTYCRWASTKGYINTYIPKFTDKSFAKIANNFVADSKVLCYTQGTLFEMYKEIYNPQDILILQCKFEGIGGKANSEIRNVKIEDVYEENDKYYVNLYDIESNKERPKHEISEYLYKLMHTVNGMDVLEDGNGRRMVLDELSPYVLKKSTRGRPPEDEDSRIANYTISNRGHAFKEFFNNKSFKLKNMERSGVMHYLNEILLAKGDNIVTKDEYMTVAKKFDVGLMSVKGGEVDVSTSVIKNLIDINWYTKTYGEIILK